MIEWPRELTVWTADEGGRTVVHLMGQLDVASADFVTGMFDFLSVSGSRHVVVDCDQLQFISIAGMAVLAAGSRRLSGAGGSLVLRGLSSFQARVAALTWGDAGPRDRSTFADRWLATGLSRALLWRCYVALGGTTCAFELDAVAEGALQPCELDRDLLLTVLNIARSELGQRPCLWPISTGPA